MTAAALDAVGRKGCADARLRAGIEALPEAYVPGTHKPESLSVRVVTHSASAGESSGLPASPSRALLNGRPRVTLGDATRADGESESEGTSDTRFRGRYDAVSISPKTEHHESRQTVGARGTFKAAETVDGSKTPDPTPVPDPHQCAAAGGTTTGPYRTT